MNVENEIRQLKTDLKKLKAAAYAAFDAAERHARSARPSDAAAALSQVADALRRAKNEL